MDQVYSWYIFILIRNIYLYMYIFNFFPIQYAGHKIRIKDIIDRFIQRNILLYILYNIIQLINYAMLLFIDIEQY